MSRKVVDFSKYEGGIAAFQKKLVDLAAAKVPLKAKQLAAIAAAGGQLGIAADKLSPFVVTTSKMAVAWDMTADQAGEATAKLSNVLGIPIEKDGASWVMPSTIYLTTRRPRASQLINFMKRAAAGGRRFRTTTLPKPWPWAMP